MHNIKKYVAKNVHMYNFSRFCYIVTDIVLSGNTITQDTSNYYRFLARYRAYVCTKCDGMIEGFM